MAEAARKNKKIDPVKLHVHKKILEAIRDIKHGSVTIVVQDAHIIQIDTNEKIRLV